MMDRFAHIKAEGAPIHPDDMECDLSHEQYVRQLQAYADFHGLDQTKKEFAANQEALDSLKEES